jgi:hypothetical protein
MNAFALISRSQGFNLGHLFFVRGDDDESTQLLSF